MHDASAVTGFFQQVLAQTGREVAVPAGDCQNVSCHKHSWTRDRSRVDRVAHAYVEKVRSSDVANGGESGQERAASVIGCVDRELGVSPEQEILERTSLVQ